MIKEDEILLMLSKYLDGSISDEECLYVENFLLKQGKSKFDNSNINTEQIRLDVWNKLIDKLNLSNKNQNETFSNIKIATEDDLINYIHGRQKRRMIKADKKRSPLRILKYASIAASFIGIVLIGINGFVKREENQQKLSEINSTNTVKSITLPDNSVIFLNKGTSVSINQNLYNKKNREIWMTGEAYFEVAKNPAKPFIVHSGEFDVIVKGTAFNLKNYTEMNRYVISVSHGKVEVNRGKSQLGILTKNNELVFDMNQNNYQISTKNTSSNHEWINGKLLFDNINIQELKLRLKQRFNVDLEINMPMSYFNDILFSSPALNSDAGAYDIMERFCTIYNLNFTFNKDKTKCVLSQ